MKKICSVFKSSKKDEMYIYVDKAEQLKRVPEPLLKMFGAPIHVFDMLLTPEKEMARVEADKVLEDIREKGYFLQMPPAKDDYMLDLHSDRPETGVR
ncbi:YcgL domain-containing protein [Amphritea balenae]|uniref:YcgL domain-containing protein EHS89_06640 n=1 Tax=Amphritea balenae TaxID=452629 RepID=A0A3P1STJ4_9GAMM|nr:YcgL domain-containing protein [Amphritea balenae]RRC99895.1 YcgL domain-containing protein [Amphritea balenae]GGK74907.1 YcgL domain-containing protein [Amphritea balenae]